MSQLQDPAAASYDKSISGSLSSDEEALNLWGHFQNALQELGQDRSKIGFLDVAVFGAQSSGKSSLLSTLSGLQLPTGTGAAVTKCPIRISVTDSRASFMQMPGTSQEQIPLPYNDDKPSLTNSIYSQALQQLSQGQMTAKELEVKVGRPGHLPLTIVDTPGLITNDVPEKATVDELINTVLAGSGDADRPLLPIMTGTGTDVDINNLRTNLVHGRSFITVFTHADHLKEDRPKVQGLRNLIQELQNLGCLACFMVNVKDSVDWPEHEYEDFCKYHSASQQEFDQLLSMCGIPRLLKELQRRQLDHMLSQRHQLLSNLSILSSQLDVKDYPTDDAAVNDRLRDVLSLLKSDLEKVHHEGRSSLMDNGIANPIPSQYQANVQAALALKKFTDTAFKDVMKNVMSGWTKADTEILGNNTLMLNYLTHAWNKTIQGLSMVTNSEHALATSGLMMQILKDFILWRAKIHFQDKHLSMRHFEDFLIEYCKDKETALKQDFLVISQELFYTLPSVQASQIYLFFDTKQKEVAALLEKEGDLVEALLYDSGQWDLPIALPSHNKEFRKDLDVAQRRIKLYAFFAVSNLVENLSRRMTYIIFAKTWDVMKPVSWTNAPLTSFDLEAAFRHYFGRNLNMEDWTEPAQAELQGKHEIVEQLISALRKFRSSEIGGKPAVYTHAQARLNSISQNIPAPVNARASPDARRSTSIPQDEKPRTPGMSEQPQPYSQTNSPYNQGPEQNFPPPNAPYRNYNQGPENTAQPNNYGHGLAQDSQGFGQRQLGHTPGYAQGQAGQNLLPYAPQQDYANAKIQYPMAHDANDSERKKNKPFKNLFK